MTASSSSFTVLMRETYCDQQSCAAGLLLPSVVFLLRVRTRSRPRRRSTCSTSAARTGSSIDASRTKPAVQTLQLCLRHGVEIHTRSGLGRADSLQPTKQNLGSTGIRDRALTQTTLDLCVRRGLALTARCAALAAQPCGFARLLLCPPVRSSSVLVSFCVSDSVSFVQVGREQSPPGDDRGHR